MNELDRWTEIQMYSHTKTLCISDLPRGEMTHHMGY